jgi:hypothetical protein
VRTLLLILALGVLACSANAVQLWNQMGNSGYGFASQDFETAYDCYDVTAADDFTVPAGGWIIEQVEATFLLYSPPQVPVHGVYIYFMPDRGDNLGDFNNPVYVENNPASILYDGDNLFTLTNPLTLGAGHYFVGVQPSLDFGTYSQCFFITTDLAPQGAEAFIINPNGCFGSGTDWFQPTPGLDLSFALYGTPVPEPGVISLAGLLLGAGALWLRKR